MHKLILGFERGRRRLVPPLFLFEREEREDNERYSSRFCTQDKGGCGTGRKIGTQGCGVVFVHN
jgi:hypothetical protein